VLDAPLLYKSKPLSIKIKIKEKFKIMKIKLYDHLNLRIQSKVCFAMTADNI
jgi:hypothetical protein